MTKALAITLCDQASKSRAKYAEASDFLRDVRVGGLSGSPGQINLLLAELLLAEMARANELQQAITELLVRDVQEYGSEVSE